MKRRNPLPCPPTRRNFLQTTAAAGVAVPILGRPFSNARPNEALRIACIGVGGMGGSDLSGVASAPDSQIVALCDVDSKRLDAAAKLHPEARTFRDYRKLLDQLGNDLDAVVVSTPDHMHAPIALAAMQLGKHVYCQKPIAHNLHECRRLAETAAAGKLVTQMGTQIHSHEAYRTAVAALASGIIGKVQEAHLWVGKSWAGPKEGRAGRSDPIPEHLDWPLWLGVAPEADYIEGAFHPSNWRGWLDYGAGTLGDMGCHIFDPVFAGLQLGAPSAVTSRGPAHLAETFAADSDISYDFPGTALTVDTLKFRWTDGRAGSQPEIEKAQLPDGTKLPATGSFLVGEKGVMVIPHWAMPRLYRSGQPMDVEIEKVEGKNHYHEWVAACRGEGETSTPFSYAGPLTEAVLVGTVAGRFPNRTLAWDSDALKFDHDEATALVKRSYRKGREVE